MQEILDNRVNCKNLQHFLHKVINVLEMLLWIQSMDDADAGELFKMTGN